MVHQEGIALVRDGIAELNRGEWERVFARCAPDMEYDLSRTISPLRGVYRGRDEVMALAAEFYGPWEEIHYEAHDLIAAGEHVVMPYRSRFRGRQGIELEAEATWVWTIRDGEIVRLVLYQELEEALAAVEAGEP